MKITYDKKTDAMYIKLNETASYSVSKKVTDDVLIDYSRDGRVVGVEILAASRNVVLPQLKTAIPLQPA